MSPATDQKDRLWPYSRTAAIILVPVIWVLLAVLFALSYRLLDWPDRGSHTALIYVAVAVSLVPLVLVLVDFAAGRRAVVDIKGIKIDFSQVYLSPAVRPISFEIPEITSIVGTPIDDLTPMQIIPALQQATANDVVLIDIKDGNAWWVTRLLALSAGAARAGMPKALVFLGLRHNIAGAFLGWAEPAAVLKALLADRKEYRARYDRSLKIAQQLALFGDPEVQPRVKIVEPEVQPGVEIGDPDAQPYAEIGEPDPKPAELVPHYNVQRYSNDPQYTELGEGAFEQILMDRLAATDYHEPANSLEDPPDRLTLDRLHQLFEPCLYLDAVDLDASNEDQIASLLDSQAPYVALVRGGKCKSMLKREAGERLILRELFSQSQQSG